MITKNSNIFEILDDIKNKVDSMNDKLDRVHNSVINIKERFGFK